MCKTSPNKVCVSDGSQTTQLEGKGRDSQEPDRPEHFLSEHQRTVQFGLGKNLGT